MNDLIENSAKVLDIGIVKSLTFKPEETQIHLIYNRESNNISELNGLEGRIQQFYKI